MGLLKFVKNIFRKRIKVEKGKIYFYGKSPLKMKCIKVGKKLSWFMDYKYRKYQFYNEDMYETNFNPIKKGR